MIPLDAALNLPMNDTVNGTFPDGPPPKIPSSDGGMSGGLLAGAVIGGAVVLGWYFLFVF